MGLSAVSELPEVSTINDQDLLMVSHTDDGVNYTSNKLTYENLLEKINDQLNTTLDLGTTFKFVITSNSGGVYSIPIDCLITVRNTPNIRIS
jgi:hypothetical protein